MSKTVKHHTVTATTDPFIYVLPWDRKFVRDMFAKVGRFGWVLKDKVFKQTGMPFENA